MNKFLGDSDQLTRFVLLTCGLLTLAGAVVCLMWSNFLYALASCIVSAWSIGYFIDTLLMQIADAKRDPSSADDTKRE